MNFKMRLDLIRFYYITNNSPIGALPKYKKENKLKENPCNPSSIVKLIQKFEKTYSLCERIPAVKEAIDATSNENNQYL